MGKLAFCVKKLKQKKGERFFGSKHLKPGISGMQMAKINISKGSKTDSYFSKYKKLYFTYLGCFRPKKQL